LTAFHALVAIAFAILGNQVPIVIVHGVMAALGILLYSRRFVPLWKVEEQTVLRRHAQASGFQQRLERD
jgi:hypothetical protein